MTNKILLFLFLSFTVNISAQTVNWGNAAKNTTNDSIIKTIYEPAQYLVSYKYSFVPDPKYPEGRRSGATLLQIGKRYTRFCDAYNLRFDSIDDAIARGRASFVEVANEMLATLKRRQWDESMVVDLQKQHANIVRTAGLLTQKYKYDEACPQLNWQLVEADSTIAGYHCKQARTHYAGRDYVAWYAPEVSLPYGPFKFGGLPGLIFRVYDTQHHYDFTLDGMEQAKGYHPIYQWSDKKIVKKDREAIRRIYRNYCADPLGALTADGSVTIPEETKATVHAKPYNPIELE